MSAPSLPVLAILNDVTRLTSFSLAQIIGENQRAAAVRLRDAAAWTAWSAHGFSYARIGVALGNREQSTIRASINRAVGRRNADLDFTLLTDTLLSAANQRHAATTERQSL